MQLIVGCDAASTLVTAFLHVGYATYCLTDEVNVARLSFADISAATLPGIPSTLLQASADNTYECSLASPVLDVASIMEGEDTDVVVCLDIAQRIICAFHSCDSESDDGTATWPPRRFVQALLAGQPRLVVFSAASPGIL